MVTRFFSFLRRPTSTNVIINTVGNYANTFFSALFVYLLVRLISKSEYGVLSVLFSITFVFSNLLDFGTSATIYSYLPNLIEQKSAHAYRLIKSTFFYQTLFSSIVIAFLIILFPWLDLIFFKTKAPVLTLYVTAISVLFFIWQNFLTNCLYVAKRILQINMYLLIANIVKTGIVIILAITHVLSVGLIIFVFGIVGPLIFFIFVYASKKNHMGAMMKAPIERSDFKLKYTFTYFIASQFYNWGQRMDLFLLSYFLSKDLGDYGAAQKIILTIVSTITSITQVISPAFAIAKTKSDIKAHAKSALLYMLIPTVIFLLLAVTPNFIFDLFFTKKYFHTATISHLMALAYIPFSFISIVQLFLLYTVRKPAQILIGNIIFFIIVSLSCFLFIPTLGVNAAIFSIGASYLVVGLILMVFSIKEYKKLPA